MATATSPGRSTVPKLATPGPVDAGADVGEDVEEDEDEEEGLDHRPQEELGQAPAEHLGVAHDQTPEGGPVADPVPPASVAVAVSVTLVSSAITGSQSRRALPVSWMNTVSSVGSVRARSASPKAMAAWTTAGQGPFALGQVDEDLPVDDLGPVHPGHHGQRLQRRRRGRRRG